MNAPAYFIVPIEILDRCLSPEAHARVVKMHLEGGYRKALACVYRRADSYVAVFDFVAPYLREGELITSLQVTLAVHPEGDRG